MMERDIIERLMDFDGDGRSAQERVKLREDAAMEIHKLRSKAAMADRLNTWAERATVALCKVQPLGGSELFSQVQGQSLADPEYCGAMIDQMREELHQARCATVQRIRAAHRAAKDQEGE